MTGTLEHLKTTRRYLEELRSSLVDIGTPGSQFVLARVEVAMDDVDDVLPGVEALTAYVVDDGASVSICEAITGRLLVDPQTYTDELSRRLAVANAITVVLNTDPHEVVDRGQVISNQLDGGGDVRDHIHVRSCIQSDE